MSRSLNLRLPCSHGEYRGHGFAPEYMTKWCQGYRSLTDAEALRLILDAHPESVDGAVTGWETGRGVPNALVAAVTADEEAGDA